jgi:Tfp pilus assembly protein PilN
LALVALLVIGLSLFNLTQIGVLTRRHLALSRQAGADETQARELRARAAQTRQAVNTQQLEAISASAREANAIIGQRLFSWTELLNTIEKTLPDNVRITSLRPTVGRDGEVIILMMVTGRAVEDISQFITDLEATSSFTEVYPTEDDTMEDGQVQATVRGRYAVAH